MGDLDSWWEFRELRRAADAVGTPTISTAECVGAEAATQPRRAFHKRFYTLWLDAAYDRSPALRQFQPAAHEALVERFRQLDAGQLLALQRLRSRLSARRPLADQAAVPGTELAICAASSRSSAATSRSASCFAKYPIRSAGSSPAC